MLFQIVFAVFVDLKTGDGTKLREHRKEGRSNTNIDKIHD